jgi:hypothetical protein
MERNPERYRDIIDTKPSGSKGSSAGRNNDRSSRRKSSLSKSSRSRSRSESRNRRPTPAVIPRVRLRSSSSEEVEEEEDDDDEKDVREKEREDEKEIQTLKLLKSGLAEKAKETLEKKLSKVLPDNRSQEKPICKDDKLKVSAVKEEKVVREEKVVKPPTISSGGTSVSDIALPDKEPKDKVNEKAMGEKQIVNAILPSSPPPSHLPVSPKSPEHPPPIQPSAIPKPPGSPPVKQTLETVKNNIDGASDTSKKDAAVLDSGKINQKKPHSPGLEALRRRQQSNSSSRSRSRSRSRSESQGHSKSSPKSQKSRSSSQSSYSRRYVFSTI